MIKDKFLFFTSLVMASIVSNNSLHSALENTCPICLENMNLATEKNDAKFTLCHHCFHQACVLEYIRKQGEAFNETACPICRKNIKSYELVDAKLVCENELTLLHLASLYGHVQDLKDLLKKHIDINVCTKDRKTALMYAAQVGWLGVVELLLKEGANINIKDNCGQTPIYFAVRHSACDENNKENEDIIKMLIRAGAMLNIKDDVGCTPLYRAVMDHFIPVNIIEILLEADSKRETINERNNYGWAPLHHATYEKEFEKIKALLRAGADPNVTDSYGNTPLHKIAAFAYNTENIITMLVQYGANMDVQNNDGDTPLHIAAEKSSPDSVRKFLEIGASFSITNNKGETPLALARNSAAQGVFEPIRGNRENVIKQLSEREFNKLNLTLH